MKIRVAVLELERCQPDKCGTPCIAFCPPVRNGIEAIALGPNGFPYVNESESDPQRSSSRFGRREVKITL